MQSAKVQENARKRSLVGLDIVISKWIALEGTAILTERFRDRLLERYPAWLVEEAAGFGQWLSVAPESAIAVSSGVRLMHSASEGGIFAALWELAEQAGCGLNVDLKKLPLRQETVEVCECCKANPYELPSGGTLLMAAEDGQRLAEALRTHKIPAAVAGRLTEGNDRVVINGDRKRYLDKPKHFLHTFGKEW